MVSQFGSLGYTIMGKTADLTVVQKTIIDTLHKEDEPQTFITKEAVCSQSAVSKHVNRKLNGRKKCGRKRYTTNRENRSLLRIVKKNRFKNLGELHKEWTENESHIHIKTLVWMSDRIILSFHLLRVIPDDSAAQYSCLLHTSWFWKKKKRPCSKLHFSIFQFKIPTRYEKYDKRSDTWYKWGSGWRSSAVALISHTSHQPFRISIRPEGTVV